MTKAEAQRLKPGDRIYKWFYKWWDTGAMGATQLVVKVVRVNRLTVTVLYHGKKGYVPFGQIAGLVDW